MLRLRSDDQLVALFRAGSDEAFRTIHVATACACWPTPARARRVDRQDAEDATQEVFVRAHASAPCHVGADLAARLALPDRPQPLHRPAPAAVADPRESCPGARPSALARAAATTRQAEAERSYEAAGARLGHQHALPEQQRSALLMRELPGPELRGDGRGARDLRGRGQVGAAARARGRRRRGRGPGRAVRGDPARARDGHDRGVRASGRARRHMRECDRCCAYRGELRAVRRQVAALVPVGPLGHLGRHVRDRRRGAGAGGGLAAGGGDGGVGGAATCHGDEGRRPRVLRGAVGSASELRGGTTRHRGGRPTRPERRPVGGQAAGRSSPGPRTCARPRREAGGTIGPQVAPRVRARPAAGDRSVRRLPSSTATAGGPPLTGPGRLRPTGPSSSPARPGRPSASTRPRHRTRRASAAGRPRRRRPGRRACLAATRAPSWAPASARRRRRGRRRERRRRGPSAAASAPRRAPAGTSGVDLGPAGTPGWVRAAGARRPPRTQARRPASRRAGARRRPAGGPPRRACRGGPRA